MKIIHWNPSKSKQVRPLTFTPSVLITTNHHTGGVQGIL